MEAAILPPPTASASPNHIYGPPSRVPGLEHIEDMANPLLPPSPDTAITTEIPTTAPSVDPSIKPAPVVHIYKPGELFPAIQAVDFVPRPRPASKLIPRDQRPGRVNIIYPTLDEVSAAREAKEKAAQERAEALERLETPLFLVVGKAALKGVVALGRGVKKGLGSREEDTDPEENVSILSAAGYYAAQGASYLAKKSRTAAPQAAKRLRSAAKSGLEGLKTSEPGLIRSLGNRALFGTGIIARRAGDRVVDTLRPAVEAVSDYATEFIDNEAQFSKFDKLGAWANSRKAKTAVNRSKPRALASIDRRVERLKNRSNSLRDTAIRGSGNLGPLRTDTRVSMHARSNRIGERAATLAKEAALRHGRAPKDLPPPPTDLSTRAPAQS